MPATISGIVFYDTNRNATYTVGLPGIANVFLTLVSPSNTCTQTQTLSDGSYSFTNLTVAGTYRICETVASTAVCPPTSFTQPSGFTQSTTRRVLSITVTQAQIDTNITIANNNFGHIKDAALSCPTAALEVTGTPTLASSLDLVSGISSNVTAISPSATYNAFGYSSLSNFYYGYSQTARRLISFTPPGTANLLSAISGVNALFNVGDVDFNGHFYLYVTNATTYHVIDVNPNSPNYLLSVDPQNNFQPQTSGVGFTIPALNIGDWAFSPIDGFLYTITNAGVVLRLDPVTLAQTALTTNGITPTSYGATFFDSVGNLYGTQSLSGAVIRVIISGNTANGRLFSSSIANSNIDGARCAFAAANLVRVSKLVSKNYAAVQSSMTYSIVVQNISNISVTNVTVTDAIPSGTSFVPGSVLINGSPGSGSPANGINIGTIPATSVSTLSFGVKISATLPTPNPISNFANVTYDSGAPLTTNTVTTQVLDGYRGLSFFS